MSLPLLTESRMKTFRRCPREHRIRYEDGFVPAFESLALRFGTLVHKGLEAWWGTVSVAMRLAAAIEAMRRHAGQTFDPYELVKAEALMTGYHVRWKDEPYLTIAVEAEFRTPLVNPQTGAASKTFQRAGKLDVLAVDLRLDRVVIIEHKTSGDDIGQGSSYWARLRLDGQVSGYFRGAEALGHKAEACIYDVIGKPKLRPLQANTRREKPETPEEYQARIVEEIAAEPEKFYQRGEVVRLESEMQAFDLETWQQAITMRDSARLGIAPKNPENCVRYGSTCSFFPVCCGEASLDDESMFKRLEWPHPELAQPKEEVKSHE